MDAPDVGRFDRGRTCWFAPRQPLNRRGRRNPQRGQQALERWAPSTGVLARRQASRTRTMLYAFLLPMLGSGRLRAMRVHEFQ